MQKLKDDNEIVVDRGESVNWNRCGDGLYFLVYKKLKNYTKRNFAPYTYDQANSKIKFACRNFILMKDSVELNFRVYFRFCLRSGNISPCGVLSFEGESKPSLLRSSYKALNEKGKMATNFGLNENGFRHLIAYCRTMFGQSFKIFENQDTKFYQSPMLYRVPPDYVWHVIDLIANSDLILEEICRQRRNMTHYFENFIDKTELELVK